MSSEITSSSATIEPLPFNEKILDDPNDHSDELPEAETPSRLRRALRMATYILLPTTIINAVVYTAGNTDAIVHNFNAAMSFSSQNNDMSDIASMIADMPVRVDCNDDALPEPTADAIILGQVEPLRLPFASVAVPVTTIRESVCETITEFDPTVPALSQSDPRYGQYLDYTSNYAENLSIVLHETEHLKQVFDEAEATCNAYQKLGGVLVKLGMEKDLAETTAWMASQKQAESLPDEYLSDECKRDGAFDLGLSDLYITQKIDPPNGVELLPLVG
jgi:hypothetical protein